MTRHHALCRSHVGGRGGGCVCVRGGRGERSTMTVPPASYILGLTTAGEASSTRVLRIAVEENHNHLPRGLEVGAPNAEGRNRVRDLNSSMQTHHGPLELVLDDVAQKTNCRTKGVCRPKYAEVVMGKVARVRWHKAGINRLAAGCPINNNLGGHAGPFGD